MTEFDKAWDIVKSVVIGEDQLNTCVKCGSDNISHHRGYEWDDGWSYRVFCEDSDCGAKWFEIWKDEDGGRAFSHIEMIEDGGDF
jgi:hypothetical protein